jgi:HlyD family secretion protein
MKLILSLSTALLVIAGCSGNNDATISATGTLEATEVTASTLVGGQVIRVAVDEGMPVNAGDTLVQLDATEYLLQVRQAEAGLEAAEAQYLLVVKGAREEDIRQAEANYRSAENDLRRMEELFAAKSISEKQLEDARTRFTVAQQTFEKLKRSSRDEEIRMARARRDQAAALLMSLRKKVSDCTVVAPVAGTLTKRFVERGEIVAPGMPIARIANLEQMHVTIYLSEGDLPKIKLGSVASIMVDAFPGRSFSGRVLFISSTAEFTPKNIQTKEERTKLVFAVKVAVSNPDQTLKAGIPADVAIAVQP